MQTDIHFLRSLPLTAASLGNKLGVRVIVGGTDCSTDGNVIQLPAMSDVSEDEMLGYVMHEAAHIRLTDFGVIRSDGASAPVIRAELINAQEDVRIENEFERLYEGGRMILDACREVCVAQQNGNIDKFEANPAGTLGLYCLCRGHMIWTGLDYIEPLYVKVAALMEKHFGADIKHQTDAILSDPPTTRTTEEVATLVDRIIDLLKNTSSKQSADNQAVSGRLTQSDGPYPTKGSDACLHALNAGEGEFDHSLDISKTDGEKITEANKKSEKDGNIFGSVRNLDLDLSEIIRKVQSSETLTQRRNPGRECSEAEKLGAKRLQEAMVAFSGVRRSIKALVETKSRCKTWTAYQGRRISTTSVGRLAVWNTRVVEKKREAKVLDTALHVLLDLSGSMQNDVDTTIRAALTLTTALMGIPHVNPALSTFSGFNCFCPIIPHGSAMLALYVDRIGRMQAKGCTPLHTALLGAGISLSRTREAKKAILVVTDSYPDDLITTAVIAKQLRTSGICLYGLGIGTSSPLETKEYFDVQVDIRSVGDLEAALLKIGAQIALEANDAGRS